MKLGQITENQFQNLLHDFDKCQTFANNTYPYVETIS